ncbi:enoyl-CoA hydratase/isomerase family protein [Vibrio ostreicida]|uniref:enoyl-CoA hydratase/isomerase family protein n=1 Tax=Vibrio ostreicida TaxID=526588 RepID=UPI0009712068|nr:enoyl-CoA hydratase/isomerase family protein [Vibrio ostreicida]
MTETVVFEELPCRDGQCHIAVATLDNVASLNALTFDMLSLLKDKLEHWQNDERIACILLEGRGDKAFCAGGDVRTMHQVMSSQSQKDIEQFCTTFFKLEYECDYLIHTYRKPIIAWGEGIIMGGGMGLYMGASHKVVTPSSRLAMPEVNIGLYPDVGATWFLNRLEQGVGLFLGMTGAMVNASDAIGIGLSDYMVMPEARSNVIAQLQAQDWANIDDTDNVVTELLVELGEQVNGHRPDAQMLPLMDEIQAACSAPSVSEVSQNILAMQGQSKWLDIAKHNHASGSPLSSHLCFRQIRQYHHLSLAECFRLELNLSVGCGLLGEFCEGVRARLIDKDGEPNWTFNHVDGVDDKVVDTLFRSLWPQHEHPLAKLGQY